jgi:glutamate N-acetyltransferase/amino-acid N-acetyltransferase
LKLPFGYRYAAGYAGLRLERKNDLALIVSDPVASAAAMFTTNVVRAAPVKLAQKHLRSSGGKVRAMLINAGNANCATRTGGRVALECCRALARLLRAPVNQVLPASTGVIGAELEAARITGRLPDLVRGLADTRFEEVAGAIMTTDTVPKFVTAEAAFRAGRVRVAGMTKGAGMIQPNMATMLAFVMTDAQLAPVELWEALAPAVEHTYHRLTLDGDTSTNDTILLLANGASAVQPSRNERKIFQDLLTRLLEELVRKIARDGEGARKLITIEVEGGLNNAAAAQIARSIANSPLVKTAIAGADANWGRILMAAGKAGVPFDASKVDIYLQGVPVCRSGVAAEFSEKDVEKRMRADECQVRFSIRGRHRGHARFFTCDLTEDYVRINAEYRT